MDTIVAPAGGSVFAYSGAPQGRQYDAWREGVCRDFFRIDTQPTNTDRIECRVSIVQSAMLSLATVRGSSGRFVRTRSLLTDACDDFVLLTATSGNAIIYAGDQSADLPESEVCLTKANTIGGVGLLDGNEITATRIPSRELLQVCPSADDLLYQRINTTAPAREVVRRYFSLLSQVAPSLDAAGQQTMSRHLIDLVGLLLRTSRDQTQLATQRGYASARLQLIQKEVLENLGDPALSISSAAQRAGLSPKQVQRLFERTGTTFSEFVLEQRLLLARTLLSSAHHATDKIGAVAYISGFGDLSYFNRMFRKRFGMTPSDWRVSQT